MTRIRNTIRGFGLLRRASFTLVEFTVILVLIGIITTIVATKMHYSNVNFNFYNSVKAVENHFDIAMKIANTTRNETRVIIQRSGPEYLLYLEADGLPPNLKRKFTVPRPLKNIMSIKLDDREETTCIIPFFSFGPKQTYTSIELVGPYQAKIIEFNHLRSESDVSDAESKALYPKHYEKLREEKKLLPH